MRDSPVVSAANSASLRVDATSSASTKISTVAQRGRWFTEEVHPYDGELKAYLRRAYPSVSDVDDVVQESYLRIWKAAAREPIQSAKAFLYLVARRVALNLVRKNRNAPFDAYGGTEASRVIDEKPDACESAILHERIDLLADALMSLPPRCREIVILNKVKGITQREVADRLGISERTVEVHVRAGVARCNTYLRDHGLKNYRGDEA